VTKNRYFLGRVHGTQNVTPFIFKTLSRCAAGSTNGGRNKPRTKKREYPYQKIQDVGEPPLLQSTKSKQDRALLPNQNENIPPKREKNSLNA